VKLHAESMRRLMDRLAEGLRTIVPAGVVVEGTDKYVVVRTRHGVDWLNVVDNIELHLEDGDTFEESLQCAISNKLDELQDIVTTHATVP
jgi:uncharacterized protein (DUF1499 family)